MSLTCLLFKIKMDSNCSTMNGLASEKICSKITRDFHGNYRYIKNEQAHVESYDNGRRLTVT